MVHNTSGVQPTHIQRLIAVVYHICKYFVAVRVLYCLALLVLMLYMIDVLILLALIVMFVLHPYLLSSMLHKRIRTLRSYQL